VNIWLNDPYFGEGLFKGISQSIKFI